MVPQPAGGGSDLMARAVAQRMGQALGQPIVIENRGGASGTIGVQAVVGAAADGHTLLLVDTSEVALKPVLERHLPYDFDREFALVVLLAATPVVLAVHPAVPARSVAELVALAKAQPGALSYASTGIASQMHLTAELFLRSAAIDMLHVPYKGAAPAVNDAVAGQVQVIFNGLAPVLPMAQAGRLRILAVTSPQRTASLPAVPTLDEAGFPGFDMANAVGLAVPRGTPEAVITALNAAANEAVADPGVRAALVRTGADALGSTSDGFRDYANAQRARFAEAIRLRGVRLE
jgi:tripartite-type tricarboxylate transporter receptor subunit TctC